MGCPALKRGLCATLSGEELTRLSHASWGRRFYPGQIIYAEGEKLGYFCAIISGVVKQLKSLPNGTQQIVRLLLPGDFLGRPFGETPRSSAIAATEVKVCRLSRAVVERIASDSCRVSRWLFENIFDELENAQDRITLLGRMTAEQRIANFLLWVAGRAAEESPLTPDASADLVVELPISRSEIADYLGLTLETVSRQLGRLRDQGIITIEASRTVIIHRSDALEAAIAGPIGGELPIGVVRLNRNRGA